MSAPTDRRHKHEPTSLTGVTPVLPTPFRADDEGVDWAALPRLIEFAAALAVPAVCLPAYASEFYKLTEEERRQLIGAAVRAARGRLRIVAQCNHPSARLAADLARGAVDLGADVIAFAVPRLFGLPASDLLDYCATVSRAVSVPVLIQDFNPGGPTIDADFCARLLDAAPNVRNVKLEEPLMGAKVRAIRAATDDHIGVLEGWGGMFVLELLADGICGLMPGLGAADLLARIWQLGQAGQHEAALDLFQALLPQLVFSLQNMELFLHVEKRLLVARGVLTDATVRQATMTPDAQLLRYADAVNGRVLAALDDADLRRRPL
jgi:4-hydroxy-tetrahydrodipicolinate synthase